MSEKNAADIKQVKELLIKLFYTEYIATDILNNCDFRLSELEKHKEWFNELVEKDVKSYEERIHKESCYWSNETWNDWYNFVTK